MSRVVVYPIAGKENCSECGHYGVKCWYIGAGDKPVCAECIMCSYDRIEVI